MNLFEQVTMPSLGDDLRRVQVMMREADDQRGTSSKCSFCRYVQFLRSFSFFEICISNSCRLV